MKKILLAAGLVLLAVIAWRFVHPPYKAFKIFSQALIESRTILEYLPDAYASSGRTYPVLVHLDADPRPSSYGPSFYDIAKNVNALGPLVPPMIVLGVTNTKRNRDMLPLPVEGMPGSGKAGDFLRFLSEELIPEVKQRYRTSEFRILYGRSDSGLFALYALTEAPEAFEAVIVSSPSLGYHPADMSGRLGRLFRERPDLSKTLFFIYGADEGAVHSGRVPEFADLIRWAASDRFRLGVKSVPGGGHIPKSSLEEGLRFVFSTGRAERIP